MSTPITNNNTNICGICHEEEVLEAKGQLASPLRNFTRLGCNHTFHKACVQRWINEKLRTYDDRRGDVNCPQCRATFRAEHSAVQIGLLNQPFLTTKKMMLPVLGLVAYGTTPLLASAGWSSLAATIANLVQLSFVAGLQTRETVEATPVEPAPIHPLALGAYNLYNRTDIDQKDLDNTSGEQNIPKVLEKSYKLFFEEMGGQFTETDANSLIPQAVDHLTTEAPHLIAGMRRSGQDFLDNEDLMGELKDQLSAGGLLVVIR